jgi:hypothetical protein
VEHPCYKCGASVEDGTPFCPRCSAPQIRVAGPEPFVPAAAKPELAIEHYTAQASSQSALEWPQALPSAAIAVLATLVLIVFLPFGLGTLPAGVLCVVLYRRRCPMIELTAGMGARLGALTGALGFAVLAAILALWAAFRSGREIHDTILNYLQQYAAASADPRMQQIIELLKTPEGFSFFMILTLMMTLIAFLLFSTVGGAIGTFVPRRKPRL